MSHHDRDPHLSPEQILGVMPEQELVLTNLGLKYDNAQEALQFFVELFEEPPIEPIPSLPQGLSLSNEPRYSILHRTLDDGTQVQFRWGVSADGLKTLADVDVRGVIDVAKLNITYEQQKGKEQRPYTVEYGTTLARKNKTGHPLQDFRLAMSLLNRARELLTNDTLREESIATKSLVRLRTPKAKRK